MRSQIEQEIDANHAVFFKRWTAEAEKNWKSLSQGDVYKHSYRRICSLQAVKTHLILPHYSPGSSAFFFEAHNDALVSHVSASIGAWRSALKALRSCQENILAAIYFNEHPIELELWESGKFRIGFAELLRYMERHPRLAGFGPQISGVVTLASEFETLSKAVHASAANFRMTDSVSSVLLWSSDARKRAMWATRERKVIEGVSLLLVCLHSAMLQGTALTPLRSVLSFSITPSNRKRLKQVTKVHIPEH